MYCNHCGKQNPVDAIFCPKCGSRLVSKDNDKPRDISKPDDSGDNPRKRRPLLRIVVPVAVVLGIASAFVLPSLLAPSCLLNNGSSSESDVHTSSRASDFTLDLGPHDYDDMLNQRGSIYINTYEYAGDTYYVPHVSIQQCENSGDLGMGLVRVWVEFYTHNQQHIGQNPSIQIDYLEPGEIRTGTWDMSSSIGSNDYPSEEHPYHAMIYASIDGGTGFLVEDIEFHM